MNENIDNYADLLTLNPVAQKAVIPKKIWMYWEGALPEFVEKCVEQIRKKNPNYEVNFLTPENVQAFCDIDYSRLPQITPQQKADLIRLHLIYHYGGIWLDASILVYENLDWIEALVNKHQTNSFAYYRAKNTTQPEFPVIENWLLASEEKNIFFKYWFDELFKAIEVKPENYIQHVKQTEKYPEKFFQKIGNLKYLIAYVACQKVMRPNTPSMTLINCDKNALFFQVKNKWIKEKTLIHIAINHAPEPRPKLIKLAGKERKILSHFYSEKKYLKNSLIDI